MKINELKKIVKDKGFILNFGDFWNSIYSSELDEWKGDSFLSFNDSKNIIGAHDSFNINSDEHQVFEAVIEYLKTPIEERKELIVISEPDERTSTALNEKLNKYVPQNLLRPDFKYEAEFVVSTNLAMDDWLRDFQAWIKSRDETIEGGIGYYMPIVSELD